MLAREKRIYVRNDCETPVTYATFNTKRRYEAVMYNVSEGGMYFESPHALMPGTPIYIKMANSSADTHVSGEYNAFIAQVRWCQKNAKRVCYGAGVQYMARGHILNGNSPCKARYLPCDLCGGKTSWGKIHETDDALHLCLGCFRHLGALIEGKIKESLRKFAIGNVL